MKTTFSQVFFTAVIILLVILLSVGVSFRILAEDFLTKTAVNDLKEDAAIIVRLVQASFHDKFLNYHDFIVSLSVTSEVSGHDAVIFDASGSLVLCSQSPLGCEHQGMNLGDKYIRQILDSGVAVDKCVLQGLYQDTRYTVTMPIRHPDSEKLIGFVLVSSPISHTSLVMEKISELLVLVCTIALLASVILMTLFARRQSAPLREMANTARAFGHGELTARVQTDGRNSQEIEELALAFNNMAAELQKSEYQRQEFVANVSHELKTPMTTIAGYIDGILDGTIPPQRQQYYLQIVSDETKRLSRLVRSMLDVSRLQSEGGISEDQKVHFDLCEACGQVLISFEQKINEKNLDIQVEMPEHPVFTIAHRDHITQVIYNLMDNAVKFCPQGGVLALKILEGGSKAYVSVTNDGPTIPPEELPLVFDRFHKIDKSRAENRESWGLGLYIVKTIVCGHGEDISVASKDGKTTFTFTMPLVN